MTSCIAEPATIHSDPLKTIKFAKLLVLTVSPTHLATEMLIEPTILERIINMIIGNLIRYFKETERADIYWMKEVGHSFKNAIIFLAGSFFAFSSSI